MKDLFTIGEMSKLFDINKKTLRYYDEIDLFKPSYIDEKNSYRYYSTEQFEQLNKIKYLKEFGMSLNIIKSHLNSRSIDKMLNLFEIQKNIIEEKIMEIDFDDRSVVILKEKVKSYKDLEISIRKLDINPNKFMSSIESMLTRVSKSKGLPSINPIVDIGNSISLKHIVPLRAHDIETLDGDINVRLSK